MTTYRTLTSFEIPRCKAVAAPPLPEILLYAPPTGFLLPGLTPGNALASDLGNMWPHACEPTLPYRERGPTLPLGRVVSYRDGLLFLPNTSIAVFREVGREMKEVLRRYAELAGADFDLKAHFMTGADKEIAEALGKAAEIIAELLTDEESVQGAIGVPSGLRSSLGKNGAIILPYTELVHVAVIDAKPSNVLQGILWPQTAFLYLVREDETGGRSAFSLNLHKDEHGNQPFAFAAPIAPAADRESTKARAHEATAVTLIAARAASDIAALWLDAERERLGKDFLSALREQALKIDAPTHRAKHIARAMAAERRARGTTDATIAKVVLERLGATVTALAAAPYTAYKIFDPIADLQATAKGCT